jgi:hypothetical protein
VPGQQIAARTVTDAPVMDLVRDLAWTVEVEVEFAGGLSPLEWCNSGP